MYNKFVYSFLSSAALLLRASSQGLGDDRGTQNDFVTLDPERSVPNCNFNGVWSNWSPWEGCSSSSSSNRRLRQRSCQGVPVNCRPLVGFNCTGDYLEQRSCAGATLSTAAGGSKVTSHLPHTTTTYALTHSECNAGAWTEWRESAPCSQECGNCGSLQITRHRTGVLKNGVQCQPTKFFEWRKSFCNPTPCYSNNTRSCCHQHVVESRGVGFVCVPPK